MQMRPAPSHVPVMLKEVMALLECRPGGFYVDGTAGGGGYSEAVLEASAPDGRLLVLDWDVKAMAVVKERLHAWKDRVIFEDASFADLPLILDRLGLGRVDGIALDLGLSSFQLEDPTRGFSFRHDGPLDMRMDAGLKQTAADLVNGLSERNLADLIYRLGEERWSKRIARAVVLRRKERPFSRASDLAEVVRSAVPGTKDSRRIHPATRTFQALRMAVNQELETLERFLSGALDVLKPGGRLCIVAFQSLEDRMVKERFREWSRSCRCPENVVQCRCEGRPRAIRVTRKALRPSEEEVEFNPRSRSARLRAIEKCEYAPSSAA